MQLVTYVEAGRTIEQLNHVAHRGLAGLREIWEQLLNHVEHDGLTGHKLPTLENLNREHQSLWSMCTSYVSTVSDLDKGTNYTVTRLLVTMWEPNHVSICPLLSRNAQSLQHVITSIQAYWSNPQQHYGQPLDFHL